MLRNWARVKPFWTQTISVLGVITSRIWRSPKRNTFSRRAASSASTVPVWAPAAIRVRISASPISWGAPVMPMARLIRVVNHWSRAMAGEKALPTRVRGPETAKATVSERCQAMVLGRVSQKMSRIRVTPMVETSTATEGLPMISTISTVARAAAAVLTRLLLRRTVAKKRSGRRMRAETRWAPRFPVFWRWSRRALGRALKAVSDAEKKAERMRHRASSPHLHESPASIAFVTSVAVGRVGSWV